MCTLPAGYKYSFAKHNSKDVLILARGLQSLFAQVVATMLVQRRS
ncbi:hypothetical protein SOVF_163690 [Spinacia oleracea]|nr:hypothetical protein SOVF_163690 [Spinacia oleracea]